MERPDRKEAVASDERNPIFAFQWTAGIGRPATMFWYEGRVLLAGMGTRAEEWLLDRGAIAVGMLRFGGAGAEEERAVHDGDVVAVGAGDLVGDLVVRVGRRN